MSITARLLDRDSHPISSRERKDMNGLAVATFPAFVYEHFEEDFVAGGTNEMAVNGLSTGGAILNIHDGTGALDAGTLDWPMTGDIWVESAPAMHAGTNGLDTTTLWANKTFFDGGISFDPNVYSSLQFWINTQVREVDSDIKISFEDALQDNVGIKLLLSAYVTWQVGVWAFVSIPIADFGLIGLVQRLEVAPRGGPQHQYIDEIQLSTAGGAALGPQVYSVCAPRGCERRVYGIRLTLVANAAGWLHSTFADLPALLAGILIRVRDRLTGDILFSGVLNDNMDLFSHFTAEDIITFLASGRLVTFIVRYDEPLTLRYDACMEIVIRDDLSTLLRLQARAFGGQRFIVRGETIEDIHGQ